MEAMGNSAELTLVVLGRTGNGKSATCNSILGRTVFKSMRGSSSVTRICERSKTVLNDQIINVIDTPAMLDFSGEFESVCDEIVKSVEMAPQGIDAFILVCTIKTRFSKEELNSFKTLQKLFGRNMVDYVIVVFTRGDALEPDQTLTDYIGLDFPGALREVLDLCENRYVLFDNRTNDELQKSKQVNELITLVNVMLSNMVESLMLG